MNSNVLENLICKSFNLETRKDFREKNKGNTIPLDLTLSCDLAYIRSNFKRILVKSEFVIIVIKDNCLGRTIIDINSFKNGWSLKTVEGRENILKYIEETCSHINKEGLIPVKIILE